MASSKHILDAVATARAEQRQLVITGSSSKRNWLPSVSAEMLTTTEDTGIVSYDASELVVVARAGTSIRELTAELGKQNQALAFEAPLFYGAGTVGGMVSSGLSGPSRPWHGSVRDAVLGVTLVNGLAQELSFGGQVMKNVAGYDVSRLCTGAYGALGVVLQASLRTRPLAHAEATLRFAMDAAGANEFCRQLAGQYLPITATWWLDEQLYLRLSGTEASVTAAVATLGGEQVQEHGIWPQIANHTHDFFKASAPGGHRHAEQKLWRIVVPPAAPMPDSVSGCLASEWAGGQRWLWHEEADYVHDYAQRHKGWAWALGQPITLDPIQAHYMQAIKQAFDPDSLFVSPLAFDVTAEHG